MMRSRRIQLVAAIALAVAASPFAVLGYLYWYYLQPFNTEFEPLVVSRAELACGEIMVTQTFFGLPFDGYEVYLFQRRPSETEWTRYFLEHEALFWRSEIVVSEDGQSADVLNYGEVVAVFDCESEELTWLAWGQVRPGGAPVADPMAK